MMGTEAEEILTSQDAMRNRVRLFAEGVVKMVSPVLLALALRKVDLKGEGSWFVRGSISLIATAAMVFGILLMALLWLCLSKLLTRLEWLHHDAPKLLVLLSAILLMCLASDILLLISMNYKLYAISVPPLAGLIILCYIWSLRGNEEAPVSTSPENEAPIGTPENEEAPVGTPEDEEEAPLGTPEDEEEASVGTPENEGAPVGTLENEEAPVGTSQKEEAPIGTSRKEEAPGSTSQKEEDPVGNSRKEEAPIGGASQKKSLIERCDRELENSVDFSAAFTALLFLGLERLALEVQQTSNGEGMPHDHLESSLALSFITCVVGVAIMFVWTIPPPTMHDKMIPAMRRYIEASNVALALLITGIVLWITWAPLKEMALWVIVPPLISFLCGIYLHFDYLSEQNQPKEDNQIKPRQKVHIVDIEPQEQLQGDQPDGHQKLQGHHHDDGVQPQPKDGNQHPNVHVKEGNMEAGVQQPTATGNQQPQENKSTDAQPQAPPEASEAKPPSLELTKFTFAGFLAVSIPSITNCSLSGWAHAFILLTAISVVSALVWRLLAHRADPSPAEVAAAIIASSCAHAFAIAALVPFAVMAYMNARFVVPDCLHKY